MGQRGFSDEFRAFVFKYITSVEQIEVMLILYAENSRSWTADEISAILRTNKHSIASRLKALKRFGFAMGDDASGYRYAANGTLSEMVKKLQAEYATRRFSVIELVFSRPDGAQSFADAFRLREDDGDRP